MELNIKTIDGKREIKLKSSAYFAIRYKAEFHKDALKDIFEMLVAVEECKDENGKIVFLNSELFETLMNLTWVLAKNANENIEPPQAFFDNNEIPLLDEVDNIVDMIMMSLGTTIDSKKNMNQAAM